MDVSNKVIVLPEDEKIEPVIDRYIYRTNYFVEYLHFRLDGFIDHRSNMFVLNDQYETRRRIRGTQRGYSSKPLNIALLNVF